MTDIPTPRLAPLSPDEWNAEAMDALGVFPSSRDFVLKQWHENTGDGRGSHMLGLLAHYPELAKAYLTLNKHIAVDSTLNFRERELIILRTSWLKKSEYEYVQHLILGARAGISEDDIGRIQIGSKAAGFEPKDAMLIQVVDDLHKDSKISPATWEELNKFYNHHQVMDMIFLMGAYTALGLAINSFDIPLETGCHPIDHETRARMMK